MRTALWILSALAAAAVQAATPGKYSLSTRGVLLSSTLSATQVVGLAYEEPLCTPSLKSYPPDCGFSLRCVKDR